MFRHLVPLAAGALVLLAGCGDASAPSGQPGDVTVRAYVDRDASGTFTTGDLGIQGVRIIATSTTSDRGADTVTTDGTGSATFEDLVPGGYTLSYVAEDIPTGAVLTTNPSPTVGVSFQGTVSGQPEFRFSFLPGALTGRIYRDDNGNGSYDAGTDTPGGGLVVTLRSSSNGTPGAVVAVDTTDAEGVWAFPRLAAGNYFVEFEQPEGIQYNTGASVAVSVGPSATATVPGIFTGSLVVNIASARARAAGANVETEGVVTVAPGTFTVGTGSANSELWIQDATGGIAVFQVPTNTAAGIVVGSRVAVKGTRFDSNGQEGIGNSSTTATITLRGAPDSVVTPQLVTIEQATARTGFEGELVTLSGFTVATVGGGTGDYSVTGTVNGTAFTLRIESSTGIPRTTFTVGSRYNVTGILTEFNGTSQIKPRSTADIAGPTPIGTVRTQALGGVYTVVGNVTAAPGAFTSGTNGVNSEIWVQDASGGIAVFSVPTARTDLPLGTLVEVSGTLGQFGNQLQLATNPTVTVLGTGAPVTPRTVTGTELIARTYEGELVRLGGFTVTSVATGTATSFNVTGTAATGETIVLRITGPTTTQPNTGLTRADFTVGSVYTITGLATINNTTVQIKPRSRDDVVAGVVATPANVIINEFMANPRVVGDNVGEYIELHNAGGTEQNLQGWIISDNFGVDTIDVALTIPAGGYVLLGVSDVAANYGGRTVDFRYTSNIALGNSGDRIQLRNPANVTVDSVAYATAAQAQAGIAVGVISPAADNTDAAGSNWTAQTSVYQTSATDPAITDAGTPKARNDGAAAADLPATTTTTGAAKLRRAPAAATPRR